MIYYLAHPWKSNPERSFNRAVQWTVMLRKKGLFVFSPILHTHGFLATLKQWQWDEKLVAPSIIDKTVSNYLKYEDWYAWDIALLEALRPNVIILMDMAAIVWQEVKHYAYNGSGNIEYAKMIHHFESHGCELEYKWAVNNNIPVYNLQAFFEGRIEVI